MYTHMYTYMYVACTDAYIYIDIYIWGGRGNMPRWGETLQIFFRLTRSCDIFVTRLNSSVAKICKKNESKALAWGYLMQEESKKKSNFFYDF